MQLGRNAPGTWQLPLLFGGSAAQTFARVAKWGVGYVGGPLPANVLAEAFDATLAGWREAGRNGAPRLVAVAYFTTAHAEGRSNVHDHQVLRGHWHR